MKPTQEPTEMDIGKMAVIIDCEGHKAGSAAGSAESLALGLCGPSSKVFVRGH
jgi:hypothetical protein